MSALALALVLAAQAQEPAVEAASAEVAAPEALHSSGVVPLGESTDAEPPGGVFDREAVARIEALEARIAELEAEQVEPGADGHQDFETEPADAVSTSGGVVVNEDVVVEDAVSLVGPVEVYGEVRGDAVAMGGGVVVHDGGRVHGDAVAFGGPVRVHDGGRIDGDRVAMGSHHGVTAAMGPVATFTEDWASGLKGLLRRLAMVLSIAGAGVLVVGIWPRQVQEVAGVLRERPLWTSVAGAILVAASIVGSVALSLTFVGIPLAMLLLGVLALASMLGFVAACQALGEGVPALRERGAWVTFLAGAGILGLVSLLPVVGPMSLLAVSCAAVGAALVTRMGSRPRQRVV